MLNVVETALRAIGVQPSLFGNAQKITVYEAMRPMMMWPVMRMKAPTTATMTIQLRTLTAGTAAHDTQDGSSANALQMVADHVAAGQ